MRRCRRVSSTEDLTRVQDAKMWIRGSPNEPSKKGPSPTQSMGPRRRAPAGQLHRAERSRAHSLPVRGLGVRKQEVGAAPGAPGPLLAQPLCPRFSPPPPLHSLGPEPWEASGRALPAGLRQKQQNALSAVSDTHRPETSNETSSSGGGGSSGSRNRTSKMAAPSATPPLRRAEGSLGGRECFTKFAPYRKNLGPYLPLLVDSASSDGNFSGPPPPVLQENSDPAEDYLPRR